MRKVFARAALAATLGGTGAYAGARGTFTSRGIRESVSADVVRLLP